MTDNDKKHSPLRVSINGKLAPESQYTVATVDRTVGGRSTDRALVIVERAPNLFLQNATLRPTEAEQQISIFNGATRIFWGVVDAAGYSVSEDPDTKQLSASIQPWHFGPPITGAQYVSVNRDNKGHNSNTVEATSLPIVFNGFLDASRAQVSETTATLPVNKTTKPDFTAIRRDGTRSVDKCHMLVPVEAVQTPLGVTKYTPVFLPYQLGGASANSSAWTLRDAARYLCTLGNYEAYIDNPDEHDYDALPDFILPRTEIKIGEHLPKMLDDLLTPYGYTWYVDVGDSEQQAARGIGAAVQSAIAAAIKRAGKPSIKFLKYGSGREVDAMFAAVGKPAEWSTTNICSAELEYSIAETINEIHVMGGKFSVEGTFELYRVSENKWVANEAGDYFLTTFPAFRLPGTEETSQNSDRVPVPDLSLWFPDSLLGAMAGSAVVSRVQTRRRFKPVFATSTTTEGDTQPKGPHNGYLIEVIDLAQEDVAEADKVWIPIDKIQDAMFRHVRVLQDECGIVFEPGVPDDDDDFAEPVENLYIKALGSNARMRITASVQGDFAVQVVVTRAGNVKSPSTIKTTFVWNDDDRWPCRRVITAGRYKSQYADDESTAKTPSVNDIIADMRRCAREVLARTDAARISGTLTFDSFDVDVPLGGIVKKIAGRELTMATRSVSESPLYPQILGIHWDAERAEVSASLSAEPEIGLEIVQ